MDLKPLSDFFDHVYVLTIKRATDRHVKMNNELGSIDYELFYGMDKNDFTIQEIIEKGIYSDELARKHERLSKPPSHGMVACAWGHRLIYEDMVKNNYKNALILEDDVIIDKEKVLLLPQIFSELPSDWGVIYFGFAKNEKAPKLSFLKKGFYHLLSSLNLLKYGHETIRNLYPRKVTEHIYTSGFHDCAHAYGVTYDAAVKLISMQTPVSYYPDNLLAFAITSGVVKGYITIPKIINQEYQLGTSTHSYINE